MPIAQITVNVQRLDSSKQVKGDWLTEFFEVSLNMIHSVPPLPTTNKTFAYSPFKILEDIKLFIQMILFIYYIE